MKTLEGLTQNARELRAVDRALELHQRDEGALLPVLHAIVDQIGYVPTTSHEKLAKALGLSRADVLGVVSFYHDFRSQPLAAHHLKICRAEACQASGGRKLEEDAQSSLGVAFGATSSTHDVTLEAIYCLGNCALAPAVMFDDRLRGKVTVPQLRAWMDEHRRNSGGTRA